MAGGAGKAPRTLSKAEEAKFIVELKKLEAKIDDILATLKSLTTSNKPAEKETN